jgi:hypothetical protein
MPVWYVYDKKGKKKRKAKPSEIPEPLESGIDSENGIEILKRTRKGGIKHEKKKN